MDSSEPILDRETTEKLLLFGAIFQDSVVKPWAIMISKLNSDLFSNALHIDIVEAIKKVFSDGTSLSSHSIEMRCVRPEGVSQYIESLPNMAASMGVIINTNEDFMYYLNLTEKYGQAHKLSSLLDEFQNKFSNAKLVFEWATQTRNNGFNEELSGLVNKIANIKGEDVISHSGYTVIGPIVNDVHESMKEASLGQTPANLLPCGYPSLEELYLPMRGLLHVIAALSSAGKTSIATNLALGTALSLKLNGEKGHVAINTMEDSSFNVVKRMIASLARINSDYIMAGYVPKLQMEAKRRYAKAIAILSFLFSTGVLVINDNAGLSIEDLRLDATVGRYKHGRRVLGISDYVEMFVPSKGEGNLREDLRLQKISQNLHRLAKEQNSVELLLSQYAKVTTESMIAGPNPKNSSGIHQACKVFGELWNYSYIAQDKEKFPSFRENKIPDWAKTDMHQMNSDDKLRVAYLLLHKNAHSKGNSKVRLYWRPEYSLFEDPKWDKNESVFNLDFLIEELGIPTDVLVPHILEDFA
jgi:replicative DNA helicase